MPPPPTTTTTDLEDNWDGVDPTCSAWERAARYSLWRDVAEKWETEERKKREVSTRDWSRGITEAHSA